MHDLKMEIYADVLKYYPKARVRLGAGVNALLTERGGSFGVATFGTRRLSGDSLACILVT